MKNLESKFDYIKRKNRFLLLQFFLFMLEACQSPSKPDYYFKIIPETTARTPTSPLLFSHFIEIGFGYQVPPLMSERFFNRSFEKIPPYNGKSKNSLVLGTLYCGLKAVGYLMHWQRKGEIVDFVNFNNLSNTHGQVVIETPKEGAYLTAPGKVYELLSRIPVRWPLVIEKYKAKRNDIIQGQAAYSLNKDTLVIYALNRSDTAKTMEFDFSLLGKNFSIMNISMLDADNIFARNKIDKPNEIKRTDWVEKINKNHIRLQSPARSFIQAILTTNE